MTEGVLEHPALWAIYGMRLEDADEYRYIGLTRIGTERRLYIHKRDALKRTHHVSKWVNKNSESVAIDIIEECPVGDEDYLFAAEIRWIKHFRDLGHPLTNHSDGGASGSYGARWTIPEENRRGGEKHPLYGKPMSDETKAALSKAKLGKKRTLESRRKQGESISGEKHWTNRIDRSISSPGREAGFVVSDETRRKISEAGKNRAPASEETRRKISEGNKGKVISPEQRAKISAAISGEKHHAYGKAAVNKGVPMSDEQKQKLALTLPKSRCAAWHGKRNYVDPHCEVCTEKVVIGEEERFSTPDEIIAAKELWKANRDPEKLASQRAKMSASQRKRPPVSDETKAKLSAASKGRPGKPASAETRAKQSAAKKGRVLSDETKRKMAESQHNRRHTEQGIVKPGCEFCEISS